MDRRTGGRPPDDAVLMLRVLVLRELYALSDESSGVPGHRSVGNLRIATAIP